MTIRDGHLAGDNTVYPYNGDPQDGLTLPLKATQSSQISTEFVYRGSTIPPTNRITLPPSTKEDRTADAVDDRVKALHKMNTGEALEQAKTLWEACWTRSDPDHAMEANGNATAK
ncbi:hypothetical protein QFZ30_002123 [Arthrobacter pascens]|uniref:hypothetical protein n=1 Tax=Arthrobacter pascens TaxID=1677 RepID=UPI00278CB556|nr:hypothetical protein [Arthrobacter pascens]MDQ0678741.1 hypothetical protein [Arthrobacter pascens]